MFNINFNMLSEVLTAGVSEVRVGAKVEARKTKFNQLESGCCQITNSFSSPSERKHVTLHTNSRTGVFARVLPEMKLSSEQVFH